MSSSLPGIHEARNTRPKWIKENIILVCTADGGWLECQTCGLSAITKAQLADAIGVSIGMLFKFLHRGSVRPDVAAKIRGSVKEVRLA